MRYKIMESDEKAVLTQMAPKPKRPTGIIIMSILWIIGGIYNIFNSLSIYQADATLLSEIADYSGRLGVWWSWSLPIEMAIASMFVIMGIMQLVTVTGLLSGKRWAYYSGLIIAILAFVGVACQTILIMTAPLSSNEILASLPIFNLIGNLFFMVIYASYLRAPNVRIWLGIENKLAQSLQKVTNPVSSEVLSTGVERIILQESEVKQFDSQSPSLYTDQPGTLILTSNRIMYVSMGEWDATALKESISQAEVDYLLKLKKGYSVKLEDVTEVEAHRWGASKYLRVNNCAPGQKNYHSYMFLMQWTKDASGATVPKSQVWVNAITSAIIANRKIRKTVPTIPNQTETQPASIAPSGQGESLAPKCPICGESLFYVEVHKKWYCFKDKKYF
jgi:hypothetical protein